MQMDLLVYHHGELDTDSVVVAAEETATKASMIVDRTTATTVLPTDLSSDSVSIRSHSNADDCDKYSSSADADMRNLYDSTALSKSTGSSRQSNVPKTAVDFNQPGDNCRRKCRDTDLETVYEITSQLTGSECSSVSNKFPKFEVDFYQPKGQSTDDEALWKYAQSSAEIGATDKDDSERETKGAANIMVEMESPAVDTSTVESSESEMRAEFEGVELDRNKVSSWNSSQNRIMSHPVKKKQQSQGILFGKLSIMVSEVTEQAIVLPLRSPVLGEMLQNPHLYRAVAMRCGCEIEFTRRIVVKKMVRWVRYAVLLLRGPSYASLQRLRAQLDAISPEFLRAMPYDNERPRPRLLASEQLPDNLELGTCSERTGRAAAAWERLPLAMPGRGPSGSTLQGRPQTMVLPNNGPILPALSHAYPKWGFQESKPVPPTHSFREAVDKAEQLEKEQSAELRDGPKKRGKSSSSEVN